MSCVAIKGLSEYGCGGIISEVTDIQSPGYPNIHPGVSECTWWIKAEECKKARVTIIDARWGSPCGAWISVFNKDLWYNGRG